MKALFEVQKWVYWKWSAEVAAPNLFGHFYHYRVAKDGISFADSCLVHFSRLVYFKSRELQLSHLWLYAFSFLYDPDAVLQLILHASAAVEV